jgi:opacity protein-like surface antigen
VSHGLNLLFVNVVVRQPLGTVAVQQSRVIVVLRLGAGPTIPHTESTIGGRAQEQYEWGRVAGQVAAGIEYRMARHVAVLTEYKLTGTGQRLRVADGTASATFVTQHAVAGVGWRF